MTAMKVYVVGGLVLVLVVMLELWYGVWPWEEPVAAGLGAVRAGLVIYPVSVALGTVAILLGLLQVHVWLPNRLKVVMAVAYLGGTTIFSRALYVALEKEWSVKPSSATMAGLAVLLIVLLVNLAGILRSTPRGTT